MTSELFLELTLPANSNVHEWCRLFQYDEAKIDGLCREVSSRKLFACFKTVNNWGPSQVIWIKIFVRLFWCCLIEINTRLTIFMVFYHSGALIQLTGNRESFAFPSLARDMRWQDSTVHFVIIVNTTSSTNLERMKKYRTSKGTIHRWCDIRIAINSLIISLPSCTAMVDVTPTYESFSEISEQHFFQVHNAVLLRW